jgi:hypothetical protein
MDAGAEYQSKYESVRVKFVSTGRRVLLPPLTHLRFPASEYLTQSLSILSSATCSLGPPWPLHALGARARPVA